MATMNLNRKIRANRILLLTIVLVTIVNVFSFYITLQNEISELGFYAAVKNSNGWEFPPFYPGLWVIWNLIGLVFYAISNGYWEALNLSLFSPFFPSLAFILGSIIQHYFLVKIVARFIKSRAISPR